MHVAPVRRIDPAQLGLVSLDHIARYEHWIGALRRAFETWRRHAMPAKFDAYRFSALGQVKCPAVMAITGNHNQIGIGTLSRRQQPRPRRLPNCRWHLHGHRC